MSKPHIRLTRVRPGNKMPLRLVWRCALVNSIVTGYGVTPSDAYRQWAKKWGGGGHPTMNADQHRKLADVRRLIDGTNLFAFEKRGKFFLYREGQAGDRNSLVIVSEDMDEFVKRVRKAAGVAP